MLKTDKHDTALNMLFLKLEFSDNNKKALNLITINTTRS